MCYTSGAAAATTATAAGVLVQSDRSGPAALWQFGEVGRDAVHADDAGHRHTETDEQWQHCVVTAVAVAAVKSGFPAAAIAVVRRHAAFLRTGDGGRFRHAGGDAALLRDAHCRRRGVDVLLATAHRTSAAAAGSVLRRRTVRGNHNAFSSGLHADASHVKGLAEA